MKIGAFILSLLLTIGLVFLLNTSLPFGGSTLPAIGNFLSPFTGFWQNAKVQSNYTDTTFDFPNLKGKVSVAFDERLVPHIFADHHEDAMFVQGYITAQQRLWQMDISTRSSSGRLAEVLGPNMLDFDKRQRRMGLFEGAKNEEIHWRKDTASLPLVEAYVNGVNTYIENLNPKDYPIEFKLLGYQPEPWSILKMAQFYKSMERALNGRENDLETSNALQAFGSGTFEYLFPQRNPKQTPVIPKGTSWDYLEGGSLEKEYDIPPLLFDSTAIGFSVRNKNYERREKPIDFIGSNNWVVSGAKTKSGNPILCNDPHLQMTLPAIWYEVQISTPRANYYGVSFPGVPGVVIGFNENIAWGTTNGGHDVKDWYKIAWADEEKNHYLLDGKKVPVEKVVEAIKVKGEATVYDTVRYTQFGPIVHENENSPYKDMALKWITNVPDEDNSFKTFWGFSEAKNFDDFLAATEDYGSPNQNFVFASKEGDIALRISGTVPIRKNNGKFIQDGSKSENNWQELLPHDKMPLVKNPQQGFLSSANQNPVDETFPTPMPGIYNHYRGRIINAKLEAMTDITAEDMLAMQVDNSSLLAEELLPLLLKNLDESSLTPLQLGLVRILSDWDFKFERDAIAPFVFEEWRLQFYDLLWDEMAAIESEAPILYPDTWRMIEILETDPLNAFFDVKSTPEREGPKEIATQSFVKMATELKEHFDDSEYKWADYKSTDIKHLARLEPFSRMDINCAGHKESINATQQTAGPSWRMVVELGDEVKAWGVYPGGQSGDPASPFYDDMIPKWADGEYYELFFMKNASDRRQNVLFEYTFSD